MGLFAEIWGRPGTATPGRVVDEPPTNTFGFHDGVGLEGDGTLSVPESFPFFDDILLIDPAIPANSNASTVRIFDDSTDPPTWVFDWLPKSMLPVTAKTDFDVNIAGRGIKSILERARVEAWDWDGSADFVPTFPDWIYGGRNIMSNPGFEESICRPEVNEITIDPTVSGGTFNLSDGVDNDDFTWDDSALDIENGLEAFTGIDDVLVSGTGIPDDPYVIEFVEPCSLAGGLIFDGSNLTPAPGDSDLVRTQFGALQPNPWTKSQTVSRGVPKVFGAYDSFRVTEAEAESGTHSLLIDPAFINGPAERFTGAQQVMSVTPGGLYQAGVWIRPTNANDVFRFIIRGIDEDWIAGAVSGTSFTPNVWTLWTIPDVEVGDNSRVIFRVANVNNPALGHPTNPSIFYLDTAFFNEGNPPATIGEILGDLYDDATVDHAGRVVWEDEANPGTPYLTLDFSDTLDSAGVAWDMEREVKLYMRMSYFQVMDQFAQTWGYEWRIVPDDIEAQTYLWQVYNPNGMMTDYTAAASPAIQGGSDDTRRSLQRFVPEGTDVMVEGLERITSRAQNAGLVTALGLIESSRLDREAPTDVAVSQAAVQAATQILASGVQYQYELTDPEVRPLVAYQIGDLLNIHDPPLVDAPGRLADVEVVVSPFSVKYDLTFVPEGT